MKMQLLCSQEICVRQAMITFLQRANDVIAKISAEDSIMIILWNHIELI